MLTENNVVDAVKRFLEGNGYRVDKSLTTIQRGIDIEAVHSATGQRLLVEAKGGTSSKELTARFNRPFTQNQAKSHVSVALYYVLKLQQKHKVENARIGLAFPDDRTHTLLIENISDALTALDVEVFFVNSDQLVRRHNEPNQ